MPGDVTELLRAWRQGDEQALHRLMPIVYDELRRVARAHLRRELPEHSLQATALVHEAYLRLLKGEQLSAENRIHFVAMTARLMRQILVDHARRRGAAKRGGGVTPVELTENVAVSRPVVVDLLALDEALEELATFDPRQRTLIELRYFGGLTIDEAAAALEISPATVEREWAVARAWLYDKLSSHS